MSINIPIQKIGKSILLLFSIILIIATSFYFRRKNVPTNTPITPPNTITPSTTQNIIETETEFESFIKKYRFMFWHLPNSKGSIALGWIDDNPVTIKDNQIFNPYKNIPIKKLEQTEIGLLNNQGEALVISPNKQTKINLSTKKETEIDQNSRAQFSYIWHHQPDTVLAISEDKKRLYSVNIKTNQNSLIAETSSQFNPISLSSNNSTISITDKEYLYVYQKELIKIPLDKTTIESTTFWLGNDLYVIEKVTKPRALDFIMIVDINNKMFRQVITSSSIINRLNLSIRPSVNTKNDMVLLTENNGLVWILSKDQAITRIYPGTKLPPEAWSNSAP